MTVLIIGGSGNVGKALVRQAKVPIEITFNSKKPDFRIPCHKLDVRKDDLDNLLERVKPKTIIYVASITEVAKCEREPILAMATHAAPVKRCRDYCEKNNVHFVYLSTSYVFPGSKSSYSENDSPMPVSKYAESKIKGEEHTKKYESPWSILRFNILIYEQKGDLVWPFPELLNGNRLQAYEGYFQNSLFVDDLAKLIWSAIQDGAVGVLHLGTKDPFSREQYMEQLKDMLGSESVIEVVSKEWKLRPRLGVLDVGKALDMGLKLPTFKETVKNLVEHMKADGRI